MDAREYRIRGKEMVDYIADYLETVRERCVYPDVSPGFMSALIPGEPPEDSENWDTIFGDVERVIMPGITHWQSPHMHAFYPSLNSWPSLLGDMLASGLLCHSFTWASNPSGTELEVIVMDWLAKMIDLPRVFLHQTKGSNGGGVIQTTASESTFVSMLAARNEAIKRYRSVHPDLSDGDIIGRLVAYCSDQANSSLEKSANVCFVKMRHLPTNEDFSLQADVLKEALTVDKAKGLFPFFVCATLGTTGICAFDKLEELGPVCKEDQVWLHVDAAYAETAFVCPEYRHYAKGLKLVDSFSLNPGKWMMVHCPCAALWVRDRKALHRIFAVQPLYLNHENPGATDFTSIGLAKYFEQMVVADNRFEIPAKRHLGLVVFRLKGENTLTEMLLSCLIKTGKLYVIPASINGKYVIRFVITSQFTTPEDVEKDWAVIKTTDKLFEEEKLRKRQVTRSVKM